jgi:CspA family cold shock protein
VVKFFNAQKGYGFIVPERKVGIAERDVFVHISNVQRSGLTTLSAGQVVEYELHEDRRGRSIVQNRGRARVKAANSSMDQGGGSGVSLLSNLVLNFAAPQK